MKKRVIWIALTLITISSFTLVPMAMAQTITAEIQAAQAATQQMVDATLRAERATDLATARAEARNAVAAGQTAIARLQAALLLSPDDATRSRANAILTHLQAAIASGNQAISGPDAEVRAKIDAMRGEAVEALNEFPQFGAPGALPPSGGPGLDQLASIASLGGLMLAGGFGLRFLRFRS